MPPDGGERLPVAAVGGFEGGKVFGASGIGLRGELDAGEVEAAQDLDEEDADGATIEIAERVNGEETAFREGEQFEQELASIFRRAGPTGLQVARVIAHQDGDLVRRGWFEPAYGYCGVAPTAGPFRHEVACDAAVQVEDEGFVERGVGESAFQKVCLEGGDPVWEQRR